MYYRINMSDQVKTLQDLANLINNIKTDLSEQINSMHLRLDEKFTNAITEVKNDLAFIATRQNVFEDKLEKIDRQIHLTDLLVHGIPKADNEDLYNVLSKICNTIGFAEMEHTMLSVFRANMKSEKSPIILKFISYPARNNFYDMFINTIKDGPFLLKMIGINSDEKISVQESLSSKNSEIFRKSMELKKNDLLYSVYTRNGFVRIKTNSDSKALMVLSIQQAFRYCFNWEINFS